MGITTAVDWTEAAPAPAATQRRLIADVGDVAPSGTNGLHVLQHDIGNASNTDYTRRIMNSFNRIVPAPTVRQSFTGYQKLTAVGPANERRYGLAVGLRQTPSTGVSILGGVFPVEDFGGYFWVINRNTSNTQGTEVEIGSGIWIPPQPFNYTDPFGIRLFVDDVNAADVQHVLQIDQNHNGFQTVANITEASSPIHGQVGVAYTWLLSAIGGTNTPGQLSWIDGFEFGDLAPPVAP